MNLDLLKAELTRDEGERLTAYDDVRGTPLEQGQVLRGKLTIGVGHNLTDRGISSAISSAMLDEDIAEHLALLDRELPWWRQLDEVRQRVLANMAYNLGVGPTPEQPQGKLLIFRNTLGHMQRGEYDEAANGMALTDWAKQVGPRADRLIQMMKEGTP